MVSFVPIHIGKGDGLEESIGFFVEKYILREVVVCQHCQFPSHLKS